MADCMKCGKPASFFSKVCSDCETNAIVDSMLKDKREEEKIKQEEHELFLKKEEYLLQLTDNKIRSIKESIKEHVANGNKISLYERIYLPVDSIIDKESVANDFGIGQLRAFGLIGWEVVSTIPRTMGVALSNGSIGSTIGVTWGGGMGGNVIGAHLIIKKEITSQKVIPPFLKRQEGRSYAAKASFCFGVMPPIAMLGRS